jgi:histidinol-phosphate/aromatic aminotransferase/cobyric acid decarboxylase-like protein
LLCDDCLRITIGTEAENTKLVDALADYMEEAINEN